MQYLLRVLSLFCLASFGWAGHLTLPFSSASHPLWQGWYYTNGVYHGGVDWGCDYGTDILATHAGYATSWYQPYNPNDPNDYSYGEYVLMYDPGTHLYTLYAHLSAWNSKIPRVRKYVFDGSGWAWLERGEKVGDAGRTGTQVVHLHFELSSGGYAAGRIDPFGLYTTAPSYPGCGNNSYTYYWTACPPVVYTSTPSCNQPGYWWDIINAGDFNGDNKYEFTRYYKQVGRWDVALSSGSDFRPLSRWVCPHSAYFHWQGVGDVNGDGRDDAVAFNETWGVYVGLSSGSHFYSRYKASNKILTGLTNKWLEDVNGDGRDDLVGYYFGDWYVALSDGYSFINPRRVRRDHGCYSDKRMVADVNGDGRADAVVFFRSQGRWYVALGKSDGTFGTPVRWAINLGADSTNQFLADINNDNKADAVCWWDHFGSYRGVILAWLSNGSKFVYDNTRRAYGVGGGSEKQMFGDFTGDGKDDFGFWFPTAGWYVSYSDGRYFHSPKPW